MTKFYIRVFAAAALLTAVCSFGVQADTAYKTITIDRNKQYIETQTAYKPIGFIAKIGEKNISAPADMTIFDQKLYICDTGNSCIKVSDLSGNLLNTIGDGILQEPTGIFVNSKEIFVADKSLKKVLMFSHDGTVLREYNRPQEPLYGKKSDFIPIKVAVDSKDNLFVVSSGNTNGIVQISKSTGEFLGYFGANPTIVDLWDKISNVIFTKEQKDQTQKNMPTSVNNLTIDSLGMIYTITDIQTDEMIRKLNMSGNNMIRNSVSFPNPVDIVVGNIGNIYVCTKDGYILEYNNEGQLLFLFCGMDDGTQRIGLFSSISAMALDENGRLYVLDDGKNEIQIFAPTEFSNNVHAALDLYQKGKYLQSREPWENVLRMNNMFDYANRGIGFAYYKSEDYIKSMNSFKLANDKSGYSDAYAEHRNILIRDNTIWVIYAVLILFIMRKAIKLIKRKTTVLQPVDAAVGRFLNVPFISQLRYLLVVPRNPAQAYYGIKREKKVSLLSSTALYLLFIVIFIVNKYGSGYLFNTVESGRYTILTDIVIVAGFFVLLNLCHYLICSITSGEASLKNVYCGLIYALMPYFILQPIVIILSHFLTYNESFIISFIYTLMYAGCAVLLMVMVKEMNNYTIRETLKNIFLTLFFLLVAIAALFIVYVLFKQFTDFFFEFLNEVRYRAKN